VDDTDKSLAEKQNIGLRRATGDYLIISNDDVVANTGTLKDLCGEGVISPKVNGGLDKLFHAHMFCLPRRIYAQIGGFDESYKGVYYIDSDLWIRLLNAGFPPGKNEAMIVDHRHPASTIKTLDASERNAEEGREWFIKKHGRTALAVVE
jgi:GT2 family glycosyltransferase